MSFSGCSSFKYCEMLPHRLRNSSSEACPCKHIPVQCFIKDMSDTGARLAMALSVPVPPEFVLQFSPDGSVGRRCEVRWRSGIEIGVKFTARIMNGRVIEFASLDC